MSHYAGEYGTFLESEAEKIRTIFDRIVVFVASGPCSNLVIRGLLGCSVCPATLTLGLTSPQKY